MTDKSKPSPSPAAAARVKAPSAPAFGPGGIATAAVIVVAIAGAAWLAVSLTRFFMLVFAAVVLGFETPFLVSLGASLATWGIGCSIDYAAS